MFNQSKSTSKTRQMSIYLFLPTSGFIIGRTQNVVRLVVNVKYIASNELSDLPGLGFILHMEFT